MNQIIELIPVLELPTLKDEDSPSHPTGSSLSNTQDWDKYQEKEIRKNYKNIGSPITPGVYQYRLFDILTDDLIKIIKFHVSDLEVSDSCSFFGGYVLTLNGDVVLYPQCCGLLEEINDWIKLLDTNFEPFYLMECHPSPRFSKIKTDVLIDCSENDNEPFFPRTQQKIFLDYETLKKALEKLMNDLEKFSKELDKLSGLFGIENISNVLIWGRK